MDKNFISSLSDKSLGRIMELNAFLGGTSFYNMPASARHHGNHSGGLYEHSVAVFSNLLSMTQDMRLDWGKPESPFIVAMCHDICKIDAYMMKDPGWETLDDGNVSCRYCGQVQYDKSEYCPHCDAHMGEWVNNPKHPGGHAELSLEILRKAGIKLTDEEAACIRWHMGAFDDPQNWSNYTNAISKYPNALWTHTADMVAAHINKI